MAHCCTQHEMQVCVGHVTHVHMKHEVLQESARKECEREGTGGRNCDPACLPSDVLRVLRVLYILSCDLRGFSLQ